MLCRLRHPWLSSGARSRSLSDDCAPATVWYLHFLITKRAPCSSGTHHFSSSNNFQTHLIFPLILKLYIYGSMVLAICLALATIIVVRFDNDDDHDYDYYDSDEVIEVENPKVFVFSNKANIWETIEAPVILESICDKGILLNDSLHWLGASDICSFDLAEEVFREMPLPITDGIFEDLIAFGHCLYAFDFENLFTAGSIDLWVMKTYGVAASWTKLYSLNISDQPQKMKDIRLLMVLDTSTLLLRKTVGRDGRCVRELIKSDHTKQELETRVMQDYRFPENG